MLSIAICDDEKEITEQTGELAKKYFPECRIKKYTSGIALLSDNEHHDIIFLDVRMDFLNGIDTAKKIREYDTDTMIIFISALKEYVFDAFDVSAFHYLLKPIDELKFAEIAERALRELNRKNAHDKKQIFIKTRNKNIVLDVNEIMYLENEMRKIAVHTKTETIRFYGAMSKTENRLGGDFFRCHRGYLVNMAFIEEYDSENIRLKNGENIYMAKEKYHDFVKCYMRFLRNEGALYV